MNGQPVKFVMSLLLIPFGSGVGSASKNLRYPSSQEQQREIFGNVGSFNPFWSLIINIKLL